MKRRGVTIVVHVDGQLASKKYRLPMWAFEAGKWGALVIGLLVVLFFTFAGPISRDAARAQILDREVARLREENSRVQQLAAALNRAEANYQALRQLLGVKAPAQQAPDLMRAVPVTAGVPGNGSRYEAGLSVPGHWPVDRSTSAFRDSARRQVTRSAHDGQRRELGMAIFTEKQHPGREGDTLSIIGTGLRVEGDLSSDGVVKVEGTVVGTVRASRQVLVAKGGVVEGDIVTREAIIGGEV